MKMFEERIKRKAILTMDNSSRVFVEIQIKPTSKSKFIDELEKECVADFNRSQPHVNTKRVKCHLMRN
jgi:hypothetical protein